jgi:UDP-N-acetyl-D-glucosamine dehydrogenase
MNQLLQKIENKDATVAVIGQGYVGLPLAMEVVAAGFRCIGVDVSTDTVAKLNSGTSHILDISDSTLNQALATGRYRATADYSDLADADVISICVPTPLRKTKDPDVSYIQSSVAEMKIHLKKAGVLIILESTTYPGTTDELVAQELVSETHILDENLFVAFSPERVDPGNPTYGLKNTPKVVGGVTPEATKLIAAFYEQVVDHVHTVRGAREAEMVKLLENTFRAVNIALVNEMLLMCDRMGIDVWDVIQAAATKPFGFMPFYPGPGIGGHCIPLDPSYLAWKAKSYGFYNRFIELATDINGNMPRFLVQKLSNLMNQQGKALKNTRVMLLGMAYKPNINDLRESPGLDIWHLLVTEWDANVVFHDPYIPHIHEFAADSVELTDEELARTDVVVVVTNHRNIDYDRIIASVPVVLDARHAIPGDHDNVYRL